MKRMVVWMLMGLLMGLPAYADQVDNELPGVEEGLKAQAREMIQAGVNPEEAIGLTRAMIQQQFSPQQMTQARQMVMNAAQKGLPVAPISNKANEGAAKNVSPDRIVGAMNQVSERYAVAYGLAGRMGLQNQDRDMAGNHMAQGMAAGLDKGTCDQLADQIQDRSRAMDRDQARDLALQTLAAARDMARAGVPAQQCAEVLGQALQHNYQAQQMQQLRHQFRSQVQHENPLGLAQQYANAFQHGRDPAGNTGSYQHGQGGAQGQGGANAGDGNGAGGSSSGGSDGAGGSDSAGGSGGSDGAGDSDGAGGSGGSDGAGGSGGSDGSGGGGSGGGSGGGGGR